MVDVQEGRDGNNAQLLVVNASEGAHASEPQAEEPVRPALGLKNLESKNGVVVDGVDDHLHQVDPVALHLDILSGKDAHRHDDEPLDTAVNLSTQTQHHSLGQFASADPLDSALDAVCKHIGNHRVKCLGILGLLGELWGTELNKVVQSR